MSPSRARLSSAKISWAGGHNGAGDEVVMGSRKRQARDRGCDGSCSAFVWAPDMAAKLELGDRSGLAGRRNELSTAHRATARCAVPSLRSFGWVCASCGTELARCVPIVRILRAQRKGNEILRVFLSSRGNLREVEKHLGVSYPTARLRFAELLEKLGLGAGCRAGADVDSG
jgi:hypothetical protein